MDPGIEDRIAAAGPREAELRAADALVTAAAPGIDRRLDAGAATRAGAYSAG